MSISSIFIVGNPTLLIKYAKNPKMREKPPKKIERFNTILCLNYHKGRDDTHHRQPIGQN